MDQTTPQMVRPELHSTEQSAALTIGCRTLRFLGCGFKFNFNLTLNYKQLVILKPSDKDG